ncbi:hypothetical protein EKL30_17950 [Candidimonas sp. SYP-B2681]|uniref:DUF799 domain-containing protein n=1 Tax=Candidimonas sp. SYP-B2681 TaxID=2497686 RepID=UPI000F86C207|nr:DUF799 domain-containing protein [Candidimonas sp. SYP-B2681]RTZ39311.1 hypothetical protein EKL30_17950 [Candidimonas sp. SYP-B2681]
MKTIIRMAAVMVVAMLAGCAAQNQNVDYSAFRESKPASILVLPPLNSSVEAGASAAVLAQSTFPLAESGYYVLPVAVVDETFKQNGLYTAGDIHALAPSKLREIFGADAALYIDVKRYGSSYVVFSSSVVVEVEAVLVDLRSGNKLWEGKKAVAETSGSSGGLIGMLVQAVVSQIVNTLSDRSYRVAGATNQFLLTAGQPGGLLYGPRSEKYELN